MNAIKNQFQRYRSTSKLDKSDWIVLAVGLAVFCIIAFQTISKSSIWFDEAFGAFMIHFSFVDIVKYTGADVHPPLYYFLLKLWSSFFGNTELGLRSMSVLFSAIAIFFGYLLTRRLFDQRIARFSLMFMAVSPMLLRYSQEMRMYALAAAISLAATYTLAHAVESKKRLPWVLYGILVSLGMWTHYFTAIVWLSHWMWRAYVVRHNQPSAKSSSFMKIYFSKQWILAHIVAVALYLPWIPLFVYQAFNVQANGFWIPPVSSGTLVNFMTNVLFYQDQDLLLSWGAAVFLTIFIAISIMAFKVFHSLSGKQRESYLLIAMVGFIPMLLLFLASMPPLRSSFIDRYLVPSTVGIVLFIGVTIACGMKLFRLRIYVPITVLVLGVMIWGIGNVYYLGNYNKTLHSANDTRQTIEAITAKATGGQPIIADSPWLFYEAVFYSTASHPVYFINNFEYRFGSLNMLRDDTNHKIQDLHEFVKQHPVVWYLARPLAANVTPPIASWKPIQEVDIHDTVNGQPAYKAVEFKTN